MSDPSLDDGLAVSPPPEPAPGPAEEGDEEQVMTLVEHLSELRTRILTGVGAIVLFAAFTLWNAGLLTKLVLATAGPQVKFIALTPVEVFFTEVKIALLAAVILAVPVITWQAWAFVRPGLKTEERQFVGLLVPFTSLLFAGGAAFAYFVVIPLGVSFLSSFSLPGVEAQYSLEAYTSFVLMFVLALGLIFEAPIVILTAGKLGIVSSEGLKSRRRHVILGCFVVSAILTPSPDMLTQTLVALPLWALFEITVVVLGAMGL